MAAKEKPTPESVIEELRAIRAEFTEIKALTFAERRELRNKMRMSEASLQQSIAVIRTSDMVAQVVGRSAEEVVEMFLIRQRWAAVESELRSLLNGISSANLMRRYELELIAARAYAIAVQLARDPKNEILISPVEEMQRLRKLDRRRKSRPAEEETPQE